MSLKSKILAEANRNLELRYLRSRSTLKEQETNYVDLAVKKLSELNFTLDLSKYFNQKPSTESEFLCIPKTGNDGNDTIIKNVSTWIDNNMDNKGVIEVKLKELIKLLNVAGSNKMNTELVEQSGSDSIMFGNTPISKENILDIGNDLIFIMLMSLVYPKKEDKLIRKFCNQ